MQKLVDQVAVLFTVISIFLILLFSWTVLIIPKNIEENKACFKLYQKPFEWIAVVFDKKITKKECNHGKGFRIKDVIARNLNLREKNLALKPGETLMAAYKDDEAGSFKHDKTLNLQNRNLEFANFSQADLRKADLRSSQLLGTNFRGAQLQASILEKTNLQGADLWKAQLQGAFLKGAYLQGANLYKAQLQGSNLRSAKLQGAKLEKANLLGANLRSAKLQGAKLYSTQLRGADMEKSELQGGYLRNAQLQGAKLKDAKIKGVDFLGTNLSTLNIKEAKLPAIIKSVTQDRDARIYFEERLQLSLHKKADINILVETKFLHSFKKDGNIQIQFKGFPSQTEGENLAMRQDIYRPLLCKHPILINRNLEISDDDVFKFSSPLSVKEAILYVSKNCPQHLPEKYKNSKTVSSQKN